MCDVNSLDLRGRSRQILVRIGKPRAAPRTSRRSRRRGRGSPRRPPRCRRRRADVDDPQKASSAVRTRPLSPSCIAAVAAGVSGCRVPRPNSTSCPGPSSRRRHKSRSCALRGAKTTFTACLAAICRQNRGFAVRRLRLGCRMDDAGKLRGWPSRRTGRFACRSSTACDATVQSTRLMGCAEM
jgi:hypothetical protein